MQRDVAHLTKKVDKNRTEIKSLREEIESGVTNETDKKYTEIHVFMKVRLIKQRI